MKWFDQKIANPGKFQFKTLIKTAANHSIEILFLKIELSKSVKRLGLTNESKLNFDIHINVLDKVSNTKLKGVWKGFETD